MSDHNQEAERAAPDMLAAFHEWMRKRGPLGAGAMPERIFFAGWLAARRHPAVGEDGLPPLPQEIGEIVGRRLEPEGTAEFWGYFSEGYADTKKERVYTAEQYRQGQREAVAADRRARDVTVTDYGDPVDKSDSTAQGVKRWQDRAHEMDGPHKRLELACQEIEGLRAQLASERQAKEYEQRHAAESEKALAQLQAQLARKSQDGICGSCNREYTKTARINAAGHCPHCGVKIPEEACGS